MIIDHTHEEYLKIWDALGADRYNGAWYYSQEIVQNIIPRVRTKRNWVTVNIPGRACDNSIVFIHNNGHPEVYKWLKHYNNLVLVCGTPESADTMSYIAPSLYLPLSVDVKYVLQFAAPKQKKVCFAGRLSKLQNINEKVDILSGMPRPDLLEKMARYEMVYAVGRTAIEAKILGCKVLPYDPRYPDPDMWQVIDNSEAAEMLQKALDER